MTGRRISLLGVVTGMVALFVLAGGPGALAGRDDAPRCEGRRGCPVVVTTRTTLTIGGPTTTTVTGTATTFTETVTDTSWATEVVPETTSTTTSTSTATSTTTLTALLTETRTETVTETFTRTETSTFWLYPSQFYVCPSCGT